jgi:four helix bundle protein
MGFEENINHRLWSALRGDSVVLKNYKDLTVWQKAYELSLDIYRVTKKFPREEVYGLTSQMKRAAVSVPSNIAEGYGRKSRGEYLQALSIAYGSLCELETQALLAGDLGYIDKNDLERLQTSMGDVERMLKALIKSLQTRVSKK